MTFRSQLGNTRPGFQSRIIMLARVQAVARCLSASVCLSVCLSVCPSLYCTKTTGLIEMVFGLRAFFDIPHTGNLGISKRTPSMI